MEPQANENIKQKMTTYEDWIPRTVQVTVGGSQSEMRNLLVEEMVIAKRDALVKIIFKNLEIVSLIQPVIEAMRLKSGNAISIDVLDMARKAESLIFHLLSEHMSHICCLSLDTRMNQQKLGLGESGIGFPDKHPEFGYLYNAKFYDWVTNNLTVRQEQQVVKSVIQVNDFVGLLKNYWTLASTTIEKTTMARA